MKLGKNLLFRIILDPPQDAYWNMAVDEALFISHIERNSPTTLRLYMFDKPSITYGYFQKITSDDYKDRVRVRRITGGGVVLHHLDQTISLVINPIDYGLKKREDLYYAFSRALRSGLSILGDMSAYKGSVSNEKQAVYECFTEIAPEDIVVGGRKLAGYAQRRRRGFTLLQASLRLYKGEVDDAISLEEVYSKKIGLEMVHNLILSGFKKEWGIEIYSDSLSDYERHLAEKLLDIYSSDEWNFRSERMMVR
ncbi:MAG: lipoate--protein ligase family protein [bacterium]